jgi:hypothetical protein
MPEQDPIDASAGSSAEPIAETASSLPASPHSEEHTPMLDVHPAHHAASTWKDFFIHIATIVLGLLIAIGLEQTVEYFHHRIEIKGTREALLREKEENRRRFAVNTTSFEWEASELKNNLQVLTFLQQHPGTAEEKLPGVLQWGFGHAPVADLSWTNAQQTQVLALMPPEEAEKNAALYDLLEVTDRDERNAYEAVSRASSYANVDPNPSHMTPAQLAAEIDHIKEAMTATQIWAAHLMNVHQQFSEFSPAPTSQELNLLTGWQRSTDDQKKLAVPQAATDAVLAPSRDAMIGAIKAARNSH